MSNEKKQFKIVGIDRKRMSVVKYAKAIEDMCNALHAGGYSIHLFRIDTKHSIIVSELPREEARGGVLVQVAPGMPPIPMQQVPDLNFKSQYTGQVAARIISEASGMMKDKREQLLTALSERLLEELAVPDVRVVLEDLKRLHDSHDKIHTHKEGDKCDTPDVLEFFIEKTTSLIQSKLQ